MPENRPTTQDLPIETVADAVFWLQVMHRRSCQDAEHISDLYDRVGWLSLPWYRRAFRTPPWLKKASR